MSTSNEEARTHPRRRAGFLAVSLLVSAAAWPVTASGGPIEDLPTGHWYEVPNSNLTSVAPNPLPPGSFSAVVNAWSGGAFDTLRNRLMLHGGGHNDYGGNEVYAFSLNELTWQRIWGPSANIPGEFGSCNERYGDGNPASVHSYDGLEYIPGLDMFWRHGGSLYCGGGHPSQFTWGMKLGQTPLAWQKLGGSVPSQLGVASAYDAATGSVFFQVSITEYGFWQFNPATNTFTQRGECPACGDDQLTAAVDPDRRLFVAVGGGRVIVWNLSNWTLTVRATSGPQTVVNAFAPGFVWDSKNKVFVGWPNSGAAIYTLNPATWTWTRVDPPAANTVRPTSAAGQGTYGRFQYSPSKDVFVLYNDVSDNVYVLKNPVGTPQPIDAVPPAPPVGVKVQ